MADITGDAYDEGLVSDTELAVIAGSMAVMAVLYRRMRVIRNQKLDYTQAYAYRMSDLRDINKQLDTMSKKVSVSAGRAYKQTAVDNDAWAKKFYDAKDIEMTAWNKDATKAALVVEGAESTMKDIDSMIKNSLVTYNGKAVNLPTAYGNVIDDSVLIVASGRSTIDAELAKIVKGLAQQNLHVAQYAGERIRHVRLDSMVRSHLFNGLTSTFQTMRDIQGEEFGADGVEISSHATSAPDHAPYQGRQYSTGSGRRIDGVYYPAYSNVEAALDRQIGTYNCRHKLFPILLGVSSATYSKEELAEMKEHVNEEISWRNVSGDKVKGTRYDATQYQRELERRVRSKKIEAESYRAAGLTDAADSANAKARMMASQYKGFSRSVGITPQVARLKVA